MSEAERPGVRFRAVNPQFGVEDVRRTAEYYRDVLGFAIVGFWAGGQVTHTPDEPPAFGIVRRDQVQVFFSRREPLDAAAPRTGGRYDVFFDVSGVDALATELRASGADIAEGPVDRDYGQRELVVRDCNGLVLAFGEATS